MERTTGIEPVLPAWKAVTPPGDARSETRIVKQFR
jgi:hypothetical protein